MPHKSTMFSCPTLRRRVSCVAAVGIALLLAACSDGLSPNESKFSMQIASEKASCVALARTECLHVRYLPDTTWRLFYDPIQGFAYERGFLYTISVVQRRIENPPLDGSSAEFRLIKVISKEPVFSIQ